MLETMVRALTSVVCLLLLVAPVSATVRTKTLLYQDGDAVLDGHLAWDDAIPGKRPAVLVVHEWWGLNDYARSRAEQLARMGYVAFALDMYGRRKVTKHPKQAGEWAREIRQNVDAWVHRAQSGLHVLKQQEMVNSKRMAAIGYCFGGSTVLQLAYAGLDLSGVVSFHGSLPAPLDEQVGQIKARILVCHGVDDQFVPAKNIQKLRSVLDAAKIDWQMESYRGARHSFTNPGADAYEIDNVKYNKAADEQSWKDMQKFFDIIFAQN